MAFKLNLSNEYSGEKKEYTLVPEGDYAIVITGAEFKQTKAGDTMANMEFVFNKMKHPELEKRTMKYALSFLSMTKMQWKLENAHISAGLTNSEYNSWNEAVLALVGQELTVKLEHKGYTSGDGTEKTKEEINTIYKPNLAKPVQQPEGHSITDVRVAPEAPATLGATVEAPKSAQGTDDLPW